MRIVVALEPHSHRDALRDAIAHLRPCLDPIAVAPDALERRPREYRRALVVLSQPSPVVQERAFAWLLIAAEGTSAVVSVAGRQRSVESLELTSLLAVIDECLMAERAGRRRPFDPCDGWWARLVARWRSLVGALAPWQYVHLVIAPLLLAVAYGLLSQGRAPTLGALENIVILGALAGIVVIEARQFRRTHGVWVRG